MAAGKSQKLRVLFVDDEAPLRDIIRMDMPRRGHEVQTAEDGMAAVRLLEQFSFDVAIIDLRMPGMSGWDVIEHLKKVAPETDIIVSSGHGDMDAVIQAMRRGVYDFLPKPVPPGQLDATLQRIQQKRALTNKTIALETRLKTVEGSPDLIGDSPSMNQVKRLIEKIAPSDSSVLVLGETGTGKELVARRIHELSPRKDMPFVAVNCGALPDNLVESELFGHKKGAFTGADSPRKGLIEVANGGTLFLDELGELDKQMQVKLLRFLESGEVRRVGENDVIHVDVRVVCATNRDLEKMAETGEFREDLIYRINTFEIRLPPLRERKDDIAPLAGSLVARHLKRREAPADALTAETIRLLQAYDWQGNVRELSNALEHAVIMAEGQPIAPAHLPGGLVRKVQKAMSPGDAAIEAATTSELPRTLREIEMEVIHRTLDKNKGDKIKTAAALGIALKTLYNKLNSDQQDKIAG